MTTATVCIETSDGVVTPVCQSIVRRWKTVQDILETSRADGDALPLAALTSNTLANIVHFTTLGADDDDNDAEAEAESDADTAVSQWLATLSDTDMQHLIMAANYLSYVHLGAVCMRQFARRCDGLSTDELRVRFNLPDDLTADDRALVRSEKAWFERVHA